LRIEVKREEMTATRRGRWRRCGEEASTAELWEGKPGKVFEGRTHLTREMLACCRSWLVES